MLYYLFQYLEQAFDFPGASLFNYTTFRAAAAIILSMFIALILGKRIIKILRLRQMGETVRDLGLTGQIEKTGTPTMGGVIIILAIVVPVLLLCRLDNIYIIILLISTVWMGAIGFIDDYIKVFRKNKAGLAGKFKVLGQVVLGVFVGATLYFSDEVKIQQKLAETTENIRGFNAKEVFEAAEHSMKTTIPFLKNNEFDYSSLLFWMNDADAQTYAWIVFIPIVIFIITAVSNGANLTDGIDGLAAGTSSIIVAALALFAWVSGNFIFADYLNIMFIPNSAEVVIFCAAFIGALVGFLWYNTFPAQVFMGDTGSLTIGGLIAVLAIIVRKELILPVLCGIFLAESLSVMLQVSYFKYTRKKTGEGKRIFLMSPLHHHFQKLMYHESKIVIRFFIVGIILAILSVVTLKIR